VIATLSLLGWAATAALVPLAATAQPSTPTAAARIAQRYLDAIVTVIALDDNQQPLALGSGFFIDQQGHVVTNAHVIEGAASVIVRSRVERKDATRVTRFDRRYDAVVLETGFLNTTSVSLGDSANIAVGEDVVVLGNPRGLEGTVSTGIVSALREMAGVQYLQITAPISPGSSGGPVFNSSGRVIGITTATVSRGQNLNFALVASVLGALPAVDLKFKTVKAAPVEASDVSRWRDLVRPTNVIEKIETDIGWFQSITFSIQNDTRVVISNVTVLLIVRGPNGQPLDFALQSFPDAIPSGLAKQVVISKVVKGYAEPLDLDKYLTERLGPMPQQVIHEPYGDYLQRFNAYNQRRSEMARESPKFARTGSIELRILDFKTMTSETPVEQLLKQH
jgi:hypothetical protein